MAIDTRTGIHHAYLGMVLMLTGFYLIFYPNIHWSLSLGLILIGAWLFIDDYYQHWKQRSNRFYRSPIHRFYNWIMRIMLLSDNFYWLGHLILRINSFFDNLFRRGRWPGR